MLASFTASNRRRTILLLAAGVVFVAAGVIVGIADNAPGVLLVYLGSVAGVTAMVHPWRATHKYRYLAYASVLALGLLVLLEVLLAHLGGQGAGGLSTHFVKSLSAAAFLIAAFLCPAGFIVGVIGALVTFLRSRRRPPASGAT